MPPLQYSFVETLLSIRRCHLEEGMERRPILANIDCVGPGTAGLELRGPVNVCTLKINISVYAEQS